MDTLDETIKFERIERGGEKASMHRTRAKEKEEIEDAARILMGMSRLPRTLSNHIPAYRRAMEWTSQTKPGDTILYNFYIEPSGWTTLTYLKNENNEIKDYRIEAPYETITIPWTYQLTDFPFYV